MTTRLVKGVLAAPASSLVVVVVIFAQGLWARPSEIDHISDVLVGVALAGLMAYVLSLVFTVLIGLPFHLVLARLGVTQGAFYAAFGLAAGLVFDRLVQLLQGGPDFGVYPITMACGAIVAFTFWWIVVKMEPRGE